MAEISPSERPPAASPLCGTGQGLPGAVTNLLFQAWGRSVSTGSRRRALRVDIVTVVVKQVARLVITIADDNYALAA